MSFRGTKLGVEFPGGKMMSFSLGKKLSLKNLIKVITSSQETKARVKEKFCFLG